MDRTVHALNEITGTQHRLAENPWLARFRHRFAYISPLNHLQVELIRRGDLVRRTNELGAALNGSGRQFAEYGLIGGVTVIIPQPFAFSEAEIMACHSPR